MISAKMVGLPPIFWHEHGIGGGVLQVKNNYDIISVVNHTLNTLLLICKLDKLA
jgi:hypothetical protein